MKICDNLPESLPRPIRWVHLARDLNIGGSEPPGPEPWLTRERTMETQIINKRRQKRLRARPLATREPSRSPVLRVVDISRSGCLLESREHLGRVASVIPLELPVPLRTDRPVVRATIVWVREEKGEEGDPSFRYGISFREMDRESQRVLDLYLDYLERDHHVNRVDEAWRRLKTPQGH